MTGWYFTKHYITLSHEVKLKFSHLEMCDIIYSDFLTLMMLFLIIKGILHLYRLVHFLNAISFSTVLPRTKQTDIKIQLV